MLVMILSVMILSKLLESDRIASSFTTKRERVTTFVPITKEDLFSACTAGIASEAAGSRATKWMVYSWLRVWQRLIVQFHLQSRDQ